MRKGVFETWIREFCSLVFIQSIQAFVLTIVVILIIEISGGGNLSENETTAFGVVAIIGLASIGKIEDLTKKIFGLSPNLTDPSMHGGAKSFMTMMAAGGVAKRILDNPKKIAQGVKGHFTANKEKMKAMESRNKAMGKLNKRVARDFGSPIASSGLEQMSQDSGGQGGTLSSGNGNDINNNSTVAAMGENTRSDISPSAKGENTTASSNVGKPTGFSSRSISDNNKLHDKYEDQADEIEKNYKDKIDEIKKKQRDNRRESYKGVAETIGALAGGTTGLVAGLSTGDVQHMIKGAGYGLGIGDKLGSKAVETPIAMANAMKEVAKNNAISYKVQQKKLDAEFTKQKKMIDDALKSIKSDVGNVE